MKDLSDIVAKDYQHTKELIETFCKNVDPTKYRMCIKNDWPNNQKQVWFELIEEIQ